MLAERDGARCDRAVKSIKDAVAADATLASKTVRTFPQGSYRNRTNVRQDSDVDVCVLCERSTTISCLACLA